MKNILSSVIAVITLSAFSGCATNTTYTYKTVTVLQKPQGVYAGAMSFSGDTKDITGGKPVFMNEEGSLFFVRAISARFQPGGASTVSLYGAVEKAISTLNSQSQYLPDDADSINLVVFTGRLPAASANVSLPAMKVAGKDVNVYAVGLRKSAQEGQQIASQLNSLTGNPSKVFMVDNFSDVPDAFNDIASIIKGATASGAAKSTVVYFVLDAAPPLQEDDASWLPFASVVFLDTLNGDANAAVATPVDKTLLDPKAQKSVKVDWTTSLGVWAGLLLSALIFAGVFALVFAAGDL